jgi:hypothetical protein
MKLFALIHDPVGDKVASYEGMDLQTVTALLTETGFAFDLIDEATHNAFVAAHQLVALTAPEVLAKERAGAVTQLLTDTSPNAKCIRGALLLIMDELNILRQRDRDRAIDMAAGTSLANVQTRWAARSTLADRTASQIKTGVQTKVTDGTAD